MHARTGPLLAALGMLASLASPACTCRRSPADGGADAVAPSDALTPSDASPDGAAGSDANTPSDAGACGDPVAAASYAACTSATDQPGCEAAGGTWTTVGLSPIEECQCPTGQGACPCTRPSDCLSSCMAPTGPGGLFDCTGVTTGNCSPASITVGCWCYFDETGTPSGICID